MKEILTNAEQHMKKTIGVLQNDYAAIRAGRANPAVLDKVMVDYYGAPTAINQLAAVSVAEARILTIQPWDTSVCRAIEKAIQTSDIGLTPRVTESHRMTFPPLRKTAEKSLLRISARWQKKARLLSAISAGRLWIS